jgi:hypothetical protein
MNMPASSLRPPYGWLMFGLISLVLAVAGTCTGETWANFGTVVSRVEQPKEFWCLVAMYYVGGVCLIGYFLYKVYGL